MIKRTCLFSSIQFDVVGLDSVTAQLTHDIMTEYAEWPPRPIQFAIEPGIARSLTNAPEYALRVTFLSAFNGVSFRATPSNVPIKELEIARYPIAEIVPMDKLDEAARLVKSHMVALRKGRPSDIERVDSAQREAHNGLADALMQTLGTKLNGIFAATHNERKPGFIEARAFANAIRALRIAQLGEQRSLSV